MKHSARNKTAKNDKDKGKSKSKSKSKSRNTFHGGCSSCMSGGKRRKSKTTHRRNSKSSNPRIRLGKRQWGCNGTGCNRLLGGDANLNTVMANNVTYPLNNYNNDPQYMLSNARNDPMPGGRRKRRGNKSTKVGGGILSYFSNALGATDTGAVSSMGNTSGSVLATSLVTGTNVQNNAPNFQPAGKLVPLV